MLRRRLWVTIVTAALANALALGAAAWFLDGFTLTAPWWAISVLLFTVLSVILRTAAIRLGSKWLRVTTITGGLLLTAAALGLTDQIVPSSGFDLHGAKTWVAVTLIVWAAGVAFGEVDHHAPEKTPGVSPEDRDAAKDRLRKAS